MSSRRIKQAAYGVFYLAIFGGIIAGVYFLFLKPAPSCFDNVQNQGELGVDCGGPCAKLCIPSTLQPISSLTVKVLPLPNGNATVLARVGNANTDFAANSFDYTIALYNNISTTSVRLLPGTSFLYANETKYIIVPNEAVSASVDHATISFGAVDWVPASRLGAPPQFTFSNVTTASAGQGLFAITGRVTDNDVSAFNSVVVVAVFKDAVGNIVGASQTVLDAMSPNATQDFRIQYPVLSNINVQGTELAAYALRT